jgi:hypothetical protein
MQQEPESDSIMDISFRVEELNLPNSKKRYKIIVNGEVTCIDATQKAVYDFFLNSNNECENTKALREIIMVYKNRLKEIEREMNEEVQGE